GTPYIATHPDFNCPTETGYMPDIGAMIAFVAASTGRQPDVVIGKPNRFMVEMASSLLKIPLEEMCIIGDRLYTDIALGSTAGITSVLVLSGESTIPDIDKSAFKPDYVFSDLGAVSEHLSTYF
ncbi:MAG: HAD hydrolase-like protein, partial [Anaerolineae bacterium]|nr:HAD hydrolase-like protein [Anaerolineae bacterium]